MSTKIRKVFIFSLLMLHLATINAEGIDCLGKSFYCVMPNSYLTCSYNEALGTTVTTTDRSELCPSGTYCNANSDVACEAAPESTTEVTTQSTTVAPTLGELSGYTCASTGMFPHPTDCHRYIYCYVSGSTFRNRHLQCSNDLVFHAEIGGCNQDTTPCDNLEFQCVATGRFADPLNPNKYFWCLKVNGIFMKLKYSCPVGKMYDGQNACVEPTVVNAIETFALDDPLNLYSTSRRSLSIQNGDEADDERYVESDELVADRINLNSNEDASVYSRESEENFRF